MSLAVRRAALQAARTPRTPLRQTRNYAAEADNKGVLQSAAKRDPELYTLMAIMVGAAGLAGWHFSSNPTSSSSENRIAAVPGSEPWNTGGEGKYQYHPGGDTSRGRRDAPSALNEVVVPNVNLPKELHERYNKWGKEL